MIENLISSDVCDCNNEGDGDSREIVSPRVPGKPRVDHRKTPESQSSRILIKWLSLTSVIENVHILPYSIRHCDRGACGKQIGSNWEIMASWVVAWL